MKAPKESEWSSVDQLIAAVECRDLGSVLCFFCVCVYVVEGGEGRGGG